MTKKKGAKTATVIDIGSNLLKMRVCQLKKGEIINIDRLQYPLMLGHEVFTEGKISFKSLRELSEILHGFNSIMEEYGVEQYCVVATTALREAQNKAYVVDQLKIQNDMSVSVLEDDQEKTLIYSEVLNFLEKTEHPKVKNALISYIGAGTIGLAVYDGQNMIFSQNIPIGALKLHDMLAGMEDRAVDFHTVVEEYLDAIIGRIYLPQPEGGLESLVLTGNDIELIARLCGIEQTAGCYLISTKQLRELFGQIRTLSPERISTQYSITLESAELLYSALAIYLRLTQLVKAKTIIAPKISLWFPLMRQMLLPKSAADYSEHVRRNALCCAEHMAANYRANFKHSEATRKFACKIFDKMKDLHGLDRRKRLLLELAAILHDCGHFVNSKQHLESTFDLIKNIDIYGMTDEEMRIIAYVSRYNEYETPNFNDIEFIQLREEKRLVVSKLVAIFRLANALDKSQKEKLGDIRVRLDENRLILSGETNEDIYLERWAFEQTAPFFEEVFGVTPELSIKSRMLDQLL